MPVCLPHAANCVLDLNISNNLAAQRLDLLQEFSLGCNALFEGCFEIWLGRGRIASVGRNNDLADSKWLAQS
jgi:hypothetical protein